MGRIVTVNDLMQSGYRYELVAETGGDYADDFRPDLTPKEMLAIGVFGGKYMTDCRDEFPKDWYAKAKLCHEFHDPKLNFFGVNASQPLSVWRKKGWIHSMTHVDGSSGTADTIWAGGSRMKIESR